MGKTAIAFRLLNSSKSFRYFDCQKIDSVQCSMYNGVNKTTKGLPNMDDLKENVAQVVDIKPKLLGSVVSLRFIKDVSWSRHDSTFTFDFTEGEIIELKVRKRDILQWPIGSKVSLFHIFKYSTDWAGYSGMEKLLWT